MFTKKIISRMFSVFLGLVAMLALLVGPARAASSGVFGTGADGDLTVTSGQTVYTDNTRSALASTANSGQLNLLLTSAAGFAAGQEVLVIQIQGTGVGNYEFGIITGIVGNTLTLSANLANAYTAGGNSTAQVIRVMNYHDITVQGGGTLTAHAWDGSTGGIVAFRSSGITSIQGVVNANSIGYIAGDGRENGSYSHQGEGYVGPRQYSAGPNGNGGGGGLQALEGGNGGGGGGNGTAGIQGVAQPANSGPGQGGLAAGSIDLSTIVFGGGGGGGGRAISNVGSAGGNGGGIVLINAKNITITGAISSNGANGSCCAGNEGGGGGGAGGSIKIVGQTVALGNQIVALGGVGGQYGGAGKSGGAGGVGRIRIEYGTLSGTTNPPASLQQITFNPTVTINQASGQSDPSAISPINFTATFSAPIDPATFTGADITLGGTAGANTATITQIAPNNGTTFNIAVSGMTASGTVMASLGAAKVTDLVGNPNDASTSSDNSITYNIATSTPTLTPTFTNTWTATPTPTKTDTPTLTVTLTITGTKTLTLTPTLTPTQVFTTCASQVQIPVAECDALIALYNSTNGASWVNHTNWLQTTTPGNWFGVIVLNGHVSELHLNNNNLNGPLPSELGNLPQLKYLHLYTNHLTGSVPPTLGNLSQLLQFELRDNAFTGNIPTELSNLTQLTTFNLGDNALTGSIPAELGNLSLLTSFNVGHNLLSGNIPSQLSNLTQLKTLYLFHNQLSGSIPPALGSLSHLEVLEIEENQVTGAIPTELGNLAQLKNLLLYTNHLSGNIPTSLGNLSQLTELNLGNNLLNGSIPSVFGNLTKLTRLELRDNGLSGSLPPELGNLTQLKYLYLYSNQLSGSLPPTLGNMAQLMEFELRSNKFTGGIPPELSNLTQLKTLNLGDNLLSGSIPPQLGNLPQLTSLHLGDNLLTGSIPPQLGNLTHLQILYLFSNQLSGSIPTEIGRLSTLQALEVQSNQLTGDFPTSITNLVNLTDFQFDCALTSSNPVVITFVSAKTSTWSCHTISGNTGAGSASLSITDNLTLTNRTALADTNGDYIFTLSRNSWSGTVTPSKSGYVFTPTTKNYTSISTNQTAQNYTAATFCSTVTQIPQIECEALEALYASTNGAGWITNTDWLQTNTPCSWYGITCSGGHIYSLALESNQLTGILPPNIGNLPFLQMLYLDHNQLTGNLPTSIGNLTALRRLWLHNNLLTGNIPAEIGNLAFLWELVLSNNQLTGSIPTEIGNLTALKRLILYNNQLTGTIPAEIGNLTSLLDLEFYNNQLTGTIPAGIGNLTTLQTLYLYNNKLSGNIPPELGNLTTLQTLSLSQNQLDGNIPLELGNLINIKYIALGANQLTGSIPSNLGNLNKLETLYLYSNRLNGNITPELGNLINLQYLNLYSNQLSGSIPPQLAHLTNLRQLSLGYNQLAGNIPAELGNLTNIIDIILGVNQLNGNIPKELGNLTNLQHLTISYNQLSGSIPPELGNLTKLQQLLLGHNQLTGDIPTTMTDLASLTDLSLDCLVTSSDPAVITFVNTKVSGGWSCHTISGNTGTGGASLSITDSSTLINRTALADTNGDYIFTLPRNSWSGTVTPSKSGYVFTPTAKNYTSISTSQTAQNYTAATFCSTVSEIPQAECEALEALYNSTNGASWTNHTNWLQTTTPSNWYGVTILNGHVDRLVLTNNQLIGAIPPELGSLANLTELELNGNQLSGNIPAQLGNLANLKILWLKDNQLSGGIPPELGNLSQLVELHLNRNYSLSGNIPPELGNLIKLTQLALSDNQLSGSIPPELGNLAQLNWFYIANNHLTGNIPSTIGNLTQLTQILLNDNQLSGSIPPELGNLSQLTLLYLYNNQLTGGIPHQLGNLSQLTILYLQKNQLSGSIPVELGSLTNLTQLVLYENQLSGNIPPELGNLTNLNDLKINDNKLTGSIPRELGNLTQLSILWLKDNQLSGSIPSELGNLSQLTQLHLNRNQFLSGNIPPELGRLTNLTQLALSDNQLSGNIPPELGNLTQLRWLFLYNNQLNGNIPSGLGNLITLTDLRLEGNQLTGEIPGTIVSLVNLSDLRLDCTLTSSNPVVIAFVSAKSPSWVNCPGVRTDVTVQQASTQPDPSTASTINFTFVFSKPINIATFTGDDLTVSGTAGATTAVISEIAPNNGTTFNIAVSGMTGSGTVTVSLDAGKVTDLAGNPNTASASADNTVSYIYEPDTLFAHVPEITLEQDHSDVLITPDDIDVYKFDVTQPFTTIVAKLTPPAGGDFALYLFQDWNSFDKFWDVGQKRISMNTGIGGNTDPSNPIQDRSIEVRFNVRNDLAKGTTYYLAVQALPGGSYSADPYTLNVQLVLLNVSRTGLADSDGDGLPDSWESNGLTVDGVFVDLPAMGADPLHKDIFVELDYMLDAGHSHQPKPAAMAKIVQAFANAPVSNPDGTTGIRLHVDYGPESEMNPVTHAPWGALSQSNSIAHQDSLGAGWIDLQGNAHYNWTDFDAIKGANFSNARASVFHYGLFAHNLGGFGDTSGISRGLGASDFIVSLGSWSGGVGSVNEQAGTFMHELGHNLGLQHGGNDQVQYKPNFLSIMNYSFQTRGLSLDGLDGYFDYSRFDQPTLDETHLDESRGLNAGSAVDRYGTIYYCASTNQWAIADHANGPLDWNCNGSMTDSNVQADVNNDNHTQPLTSYNEWPNLIYAGGSIGAFGFTPETLPQTPFDEITQAQDALLPSLYNVTVTASPNRVVQTNSAVQLTFTVKNQGTHSDTYTLSASSSAGWANLGNVPSALTLAAGQSAAIPVSVQVPAFAGGGAMEKISLTAVSQANANIEDQAIATLTALDTPTPTASPTGMMTATYTATTMPTPTASPTGTMTATLTFTPTQTLTETLTLTPAPTFTLNPTSSPTSAITSTPTKTVTLAVTPTADATSTATLPSTPTSTATNTVTPAPAGPVVLAIVPAATTVNIGQSFSLTVQVQAGLQQVDGAAAYPNFDPTCLQVVSMSSGTTLPVVIQNSYDNTAGRIDYAAGKLSSPYPSGSFTLVTINFIARAQCSGATLILNNTLPRKSDATFGGNSVINHTENSVVTITNYAVLNGHVALQGRPTPPNSQWAIPLSITLYAPGESFPSYSFAPTTDNNGYFSIGNIAPGAYDARIKNSHALQNKLTITLAGGNNTIDFGTLREGDANNDGYVSLVDFSILASSYGKCQGAIGYDGRADFNEDGCVSLLDFSLMAANFGQAGTTAIKAQLFGPSAGNVQLVIEPATISVTSGQVFSMNVQVKAGAQQIDGAQASLDFNPALVHVKQLIAGATLPLNLQSQFDNTAGTIDFSAGTLSGFPSGTFTLVTVEFEALMPTTGTNLAFHFGLPRDTGVTFGGESVLGGTSAGGIIVLDTPTPTSTRTPTPTPAATNTPTPTLTTTPVATKTPIITAQTFTSVAGQDGWVLESSETSSVGGSINSSATTFNLGDSAAKQQYRGILSFSTGSLPDNAIITGVTLKFKQQAIVGGGNPVSIFQGFMFDVKNGFFGTASTLQTGDFQAAASQSYGPSAPAPVGGWYSFNLASAGPFVNKLATNSGLTQIRLRFKLDDNNNVIANYLSLYSGNAAAVADRPMLIIQYYVP